MSSLVTYQKPQLAVLEEKPKLRDYTDAELNTICVVLVSELTDLLGVKDGKVNHLNKLASFIKDCYKNHAIEEIKHAFDLYVKGEFHHKPFQQLNAVVFGQVMREYDIYKRNQLELYRRKKRLMAEQNQIPSKEEQKKSMDEAVVRLYLEFQNSGTITGIVSHIYDYLDNKGTLKGDKTDDSWNDYKKEIYESVRRRMIAENEVKTAKDRQEVIDIKNLIKELESKKSGKAISESKKQILIEYFKKQ